MRTSIIGCPERKKFKPYLTKAIKYYSESLMSKKMLENLFLSVKFNSKLDVFGYAQIDEYNISGKPRIFSIELNPDIGAADILKTLAHEMVHIKQFVYGDTNESLSKWKGIKIQDSMEYYSLPWEIEAHGREIGLFTNFAIKEKLWEVFKGIRNPDAPIEKESLGWKNN
jgi:hypothetical protein